MYNQKQVDELLSNLQQELKTLRKSPNRKYLKTTLLDKLRKAKELYENILYILEDYDQYHQKALLRDARSLFSEIKIFIDIRLDYGKHLIKFKALANIIVAFFKLRKKHIQTNMFDYKTATSLVQPYDGSVAGLDAFIDASNLLLEIIQAGEEEIAAKFLRTRLTGKARIGLPNEAITIPLITQDVKNRCQDKTTPESIIAKLKAIKSKQSNQKFCEEVENLTIQLKNVYIENKIPTDVASKMSTKVGVDALINGVGNPEVKLILKAGTFTDLKDAIQKVNENLPETDNSAQLLTFNRNRNDQRKYNNYQNRYHQNNSNKQYENRNNHGHFNYRNLNGNNNYSIRNNTNNLQNRPQPRYFNGYRRNNNRNNNARNVYVTGVDTVPNLNTESERLMQPFGNIQQRNTNRDFLGQVDQLPHSTTRGPFIP